MKLSEQLREWGGQMRKTGEAPPYTAFEDSCRWQNHPDAPKGV